MSIGALLDWLRAGGAEHAALAIETRADGERGAVATAPIARGERVLRVPRALLITVDDARRELGARGLSGHAALAAFLLDQRGGGFFRPYVDALPRAFPRVPIFYGARELAALDGTLARERLERRRRALIDDYRALARHARPRFSFADWAWARAAVASRVFSIELDGRKTDALVPLADLLDHALPAETTWANHRGPGFALTAAVDLAPGQPVRDSYGVRCNSRFLLSYGFCLDENPENQALVRLPELPARHPRAGGARDLGEPRGGERLFRVAAREDDDARALIAYAQLAAPSETAGWESIMRACDDALERFSTSIADDDALLAGPLDGNLRDAVRARRGEKRVLRAWRAWARGRLRSLLLGVDRRRGSCRAQRSQPERRTPSRAMP